MNLDQGFFLLRKVQFECEQLIRPLLRRNIISISPSIVLYSILNLEQYLDL